MKTSPRTSSSGGHVVAGEPLRDAPQRADVRGDVLAGAAVAAGGGPHQPAVPVDQRDRQPVDLELAQPAGLRGLLLRPRRPGAQLVGVEHVAEAHQPLEVLDRREVGRVRAHDLLRRAVRRPQVGVGVLERPQLGHQPVVLGVADRGLVEHVVAERVLVELPATARRAGRGRRRGAAEARSVGLGHYRGSSASACAGLDQALQDGAGVPRRDAPASPQDGVRTTVSSSTSGASPSRRQSARTGASTASTDGGASPVDGGDAEQQRRAGLGGLAELLLVLRQREVERHAGRARRRAAAGPARRARSSARPCGPRPRGRRRAGR